MTDNFPARACTYLDNHLSHYVENLKNLIRIPSISFPGFDSEPVKKCAEAVMNLLKKSGLQDMQLLEAESGYPTVFGQWMNAGNKPTILLYAHYDVQPPGKEASWKSPPFEPEERNGRLYGRGSADDKGGVVMHAAAVRSFLESVGTLPVNVKVVIEGEEEIGSRNLDSLLKRNPDLFQADVICIADSENFDSTVPSLTASLRGIVTVTVEVRSLRSSLHSGTWGGPIPDPALALAKMIAGLVDADGKPALPGMMNRVRPLSSYEREELEKLPFEESVFRKQAGLVESARMTRKKTAYENMWHLPSIAINALEASSRKQAANIINDAAWARIGIRIVPDMDPEETLQQLKQYLVNQAPWGVQVTIEPETPAGWWKMNIEDPLFQVGLNALEQGYGRKPVIIGAGGSIPFVKTITTALGNAPALLFGVGDPYSAQHSENESILISDWQKGCRSLMYLLDGLSRLDG
ncbi:MAG: M20/M25/M40 family metallo-hydrolase [Nitrospirota bacterium]